MEHGAHGKDHSRHRMTQGMEQADRKVGDVDTSRLFAANGVQKAHSSHQQSDSHEQALKQKHQAKKKASTVDGAVSGD